MIGNTLDVTPQYLHQLKQRDHNVLYTEVGNASSIQASNASLVSLAVSAEKCCVLLQTVRFGRALLDVKQELAELRTQYRELAQSEEVHQLNKSFAADVLRFLFEPL